MQAGMGLSGVCSTELLGNVGSALGKNLGSPQLPSSAESTLQQCQDTTTYTSPLQIDLTTKFSPSSFTHEGQLGGGFM